ncbi:MAG: TRAP transporter substrate-binding protein [Prochloraceae cyanobacterium]
MVSKLIRRNFVKLFPLGLAGALIAPWSAKKTQAQSNNTSDKEVITLRIQSTWSARDIFQEILENWAKKVNQMSEGRLEIEILSVGSVVGTSELINAVSRGLVDGGHGFPAYWFGLNRAFSLFGTGPSFGMNGEMLLGWIRYGGGQELYEELLEKLDRNVVSYFHGPVPTQPLGWFNERVESPEDLKGTKYRTAGIAVEVFKNMGVDAQFIPGNGVVAGLQRGVIDAAEFTNTTSDRMMGFQNVRKVLMVQSYHQPLEILELMLNKTKYDSLSPDLQAIIKYATMAESAEFNWKFMDRNSTDYQGIIDAGVAVYETPESVLRAELDGWDKVVAKESAADPFFAKVIESQKVWAERVGNWSLDITVENQTAYNHYFNSEE